MIISLNLSKVDEAKLREVMKRDKRAFSQNEVKRFFYDAINRRYIS